MTQDHISALERTRNILGKYSTTKDSEDELIIDGIMQLLEESKAPTQQTDAFLHQIARLIHKLFDFKEICVGIMDTKDGLFRYKACVGFRGGAQEVRKKLAYTIDDMTDNKHYPSVPIGKRTRVYLSENLPFKDTEKESFNRPSLLGMERALEDDMIEGDYIDIFMLNPDREIIGWIEVSNMQDGKMPDSKTIRWLEVVASVAGAIAFEREWNSKK